VEEPLHALREPKRWRSTLPHLGRSAPRLLHHHRMRSRTEHDHHEKRYDKRDKPANHGPNLLQPFAYAPK
jgi:hypothetical protein